MNLKKDSSLIFRTRGSIKYIGKIKCVQKKEFICGLICGYNSKEMCKIHIVNLMLIF